MYFQTTPLYFLKRKNEVRRVFLTNSLTSNELSAVFKATKYVVHNMLIFTSDHHLVLFSKKNYVSFYYTFIVNKLESVTLEEFDNVILNKIINSINSLRLSEFLILLKTFDEMKYNYLKSKVGYYRNIYPNSFMVLSKVSNILKDEKNVFKCDEKMLDYLRTKLKAAINHTYHQFLIQFNNNPGKLFDDEMIKPKSLLRIKMLSSAKPNKSFPELLTQKLKAMFIKPTNNFDIDKKFVFFDENFNVFKASNAKNIPSFTTTLILDITLSQTYVDSTYLTYLNYDSKTLLEHLNVNNDQELDISLIPIKKPFRLNDKSYFREIFESYNNI